MNDETVTEVEETVVPAEETTPAQPESRGIDQIVDVLEALDKVADLLSAVLSDGRVDGSDIIHVVSLLKDLDTFVEAVKGGSEIDDEFKDLDQAEILSLAVGAFNLVKKIVDAAKKKK